MARVRGEYVLYDRIKPKRNRDVVKLLRKILKQLKKDKCEYTIDESFDNLTLGEFNLPPHKRTVTIRISYWRD